MRHKIVLSSKKGDLGSTSAPSVLSFGFTGLNFSLSTEETKQAFAETSAELEEAIHMIMYLATPAPDCGTTVIILCNVTITWWTDYYDLQLMDKAGESGLKGSGVLRIILLHGEHRWVLLWPELLGPFWLLWRNVMTRSSLKKRVHFGLQF